MQHRHLFFNTEEATSLLGLRAWSSNIDSRSSFCLPKANLRHLASHNISDERSISVEKEIVTEIEISALPTRIWQILTDFEKYPTWNPFIEKVTGIPRTNEKLEVHMPDRRGGTMVFTRTVLGAERERELRWLGRSEGEVSNGEHRFLIEPSENNNKVHFSQSEKFAGSMVASLEGWLDTAVKQNFEDMNRALK